VDIKIICPYQFENFTFLIGKSSGNIGHLFSQQMSKPNIDILLATYNGARFLSLQLDSLINQTYSPIHIYIRDDSSKDDTLQIVKLYQHQYPEKITLIEGENNINKATGNFSILMNYSTADYILFSDQDDIWELDKVEKMYQKIIAVEASNPNTPIYIFSDLKMIDEKGLEIASSLWEKEGINPKNIKLGNLLTQNIANGCASIINRKLLELGKDIPKGVLMHDHWLIVLASASGIVDYISDKTINHRIHQSNSSRAESEIKKERKKSLISVIKGENLDNYYQKLKTQAIMVKQRLQENSLLSKENGEVLNDFIELKNYSFIKRKKVILKNDFLKNTPFASLNWWLRI
jgi:glycosyltransferase involved in cell wall biosynthesis